MPDSEALWGYQWEEMDKNKHVSIMSGSGQCWANEGERTKSAMRAREAVRGDSGISSASGRRDRKHTLPRQACSQREQGEGEGKWGQRGSQVGPRAPCRPG